MEKAIICLLVFGILLCFSACNNTANNASLKNEEAESLVETIAIDETDETSEFTLTNKIMLDSSKAEKSKFNVDMSINLINMNENGEATYKETTKIPLNREYITVNINNNNDEIFLMCSGFWHLEKLVDGKYEEVKSDIADNECNNSFGPGGYGSINCDLRPYSDLISEGKYRIISPTLNILKETQNGLEEFAYQNEKAFILYSEFEFVDEDKSFNIASKKTTSTNDDNQKSTSSRKADVN